jgi:ubiquinone/menaquinone biosynthesis C-methylase UbiE
MTRTLTLRDVQSFYDGFGSRQDQQAFYEDAALEAMIAHAAFEHAGTLFELGCGTGRLAERLLMHYLRSDAAYEGVDVSATMVALARVRLAPFGPRAVVHQTGDAVPLPAASGGVDRIVTTYVLDLMPEETIRTFVDGAARALSAEGRLCVTGITFGNSILSRLVMLGWRALYACSPRIVGGCRPLRLARFLSSDSWNILHHETVVRFGIASEVIVASPR